VVSISIYLSSLIAGLLTGVGALISIAIKNPSDKLLSLSLGFASGIMLGISTFSLIPESLELGNIYFCALGFVCGAGFLGLLDYGLPHIHKNEVEYDEYKKMGYFIAIGIAVHNLPEGIAIGVSNEVSVVMGFYMAVSIGIHNIAEGLSVAMPLSLSPNMKKSRIVYITTITGLATLLGTIIGKAIITISAFFISASLAFAAGAMIYITSAELIPKSHRSYGKYANIGIVAGILFSLFLR
jgi:ZIP family zinc transporter